MMRHTPERTPRTLRWVWYGAAACFILAGLTGSLYRFGIRYGWTAGLDLVNIRHAHSHLMYFGWVTPALMALISTRLPARAGQPLEGRIRRVFGALFGAALIAYPLFAAFGYTPVAMGASRIPLAVIGASLNMLVWYGFVAYYIRATWRKPRNRAMLFWDLGVAFLVLATLGAWGLALMKPLGIESVAWSTALTHVFLDYFAEGWFVLGLLGVAYAVLDHEQETGAHWSLMLLVVGLPLTFALGMPASLVPAPLRILAGFGGGVVALGLLVNVWILLKKLLSVQRWIWGVPLVLLAVKALMQGIVSIVPSAWWANLHGLRVLYLHSMLLGFVTLGLVAAARHTWGEASVRGARWVYAAVCAMLLSLLPITSLWPAAWQGRWGFTAAAWAALLPVAAMIGLVGAGLWRRKESVAEKPEVPPGVQA